MRRFATLLLLLCSLPLFGQGTQVASKAATSLTAGDGVYPYAVVHGNGIARAYAACLLGQECAVTVDPAYKGTEGDEVWNVGGLYKWDRTYPANTRMDDQRFGRRLGFYADIGTSDSPSGAGENVVLLHITDPPSSSVRVAHQVAVNIGFLSLATGEIAYGEETDLAGLHIDVVCATLSICQGQHTIVDATKGEGDTGGHYTEVNYWGGAFNSDDEGGRVGSDAIFDGTKSGVLPMGLVMSVAPDQSSLTMVVGSLDGNTRSWGEGRYAVKVLSHNQDAALFSLHALSQTQPSNDAGSGLHGHGAFGTVAFDPADGNLPVSTAWGQSTSYIIVPTTNDTATQVQVTSTIDGPGPFTNGPACWEGGHRTGQGLITSAQAVINGIQTFTLSMYEDPDGGAHQQQTFFPYFFQGGLCSTVARPRAFDQGIGLSNQALPFIGSTGPHTGVTGIHYHVGLSTVPGFNSSVFPNDPNLRDLGLYRFYSAARIVGLKDPKASAGFLGSYVAMEPHSWTVASGDVIESPVTYSTMMSLGGSLMLARLPGDHRGYDEIIGEAGIDGGFTHRRYTNLNAASMYQGMGGNIAGGPAIGEITGPYSGLYTWHNPLPGAKALTVGCSAYGCADPTSFHVSYSSQSLSSIWDEYHIQYADQIVKGFRNGESFRLTFGKGIQVDSNGHGVDFVNAQTHRMLAPTDTLDGANKAYVDAAALLAGPTPAAGPTPCPAGRLWHDDSYIYVCNAAGTASKRAALTSF